MGHASSNTLMVHACRGKIWNKWEATAYSACWLHETLTFSMGNTEFKIIVCLSIDLLAVKQLYFGYWIALQVSNYHRHNRRSAINS